MSPAARIRLPGMMRESMGSLSGHPVAEGATAPESLRPKDRIARKALWKADAAHRLSHRRCKQDVFCPVKALRFP